VIRVVVFGQGMVASHLMVGVERIKKGKLEPYGIPFSRYRMPYDISDIEFVASYDVDPVKVGKTAYDVAYSLVGDTLPIPEELKKINIYEGIHLGSLKGLVKNPVGLEEKLGLSKAIDRLIDQWRILEPEVFINIITTEPAKPFETIEKLEEAISRGEDVSASHAYAYAVARYAMETGRRAVFINAIPSPLANDPAIVKLFEAAGSVIFGDDGATGATPLTADLLEHMAERNRFVEFIVQFNIGGNTDFLSLTIPERNKMKESTKSSIVEDILGYKAPHYIKPTGYLEPLGDKKYVAMHLEYITFNGLRDSLFISARINDSPALAGLLVDLIRIGKIAVERGFKGTVYEVNAFFMKKPGPRDAKSVSKAYAYYKLVELLKTIDALKI